MHKLNVFIAVISLMSLSLASCNKDDEITVDPIPDEDTEAVAEFKVMEYMPAPGQFINEKSSGFVNVNTMDEASEYAQKRLANGDFVSLGAWGGYIVVRSLTPVENSRSYDFVVYGNAFDTSNEPGIVWVMQDTNGNGLPDDEWFELKGSHYNLEGYERNYSVTYFRPDPENGDIKWEDSNGATGYVNRHIVHKQSSYYPAWIGKDSYTLYGSKLPLQVYTDPVTGIVSNEPFKCGYADNNGEDSLIADENGRTIQKNFFKISDAIDANGNPVELKSIDFIKVQTAINGSTPIMGENSTEICGFSHYKP